MNLQWLASTEWALVVKALLHTLWQGAIIAGLLVIVLRRVNSPIARYRGSLAALASVLLAGLVTWAWLNLPAPKNNSPATAPAIEAVAIPVLEKNDAPPIIVQATPLAPKPIELGWTAWMAFAWLLGAMLMLGRAGFQVAGAERLRRSTQPLEDVRIVELLENARKAVGLARRVRIAVTDKLTSPAVAGVLVPTLIMPISLTTTLTHEQIRFILLHELAHIRRGDYFANLFQLFAEALLFFNPAVWWISRQMRIEREACCDALAIELSGAPADYARTLVHVAENVLQAAPVAAPAFGDEREPSSLADRVQRLLVPGYRPRLRLTWRAMLASLFVGGALLTLTAAGTRTTVAAVMRVPPTTAPTSTNSEVRLPQVLIQAEIYRMNQSDFQKIVSDPAYVNTRQDKGENFQQLKRLLTSSGFQPIQRPRIKTNSGMPAQFYVGDLTNSIEFACQPVVTNGQIDLTSRITMISAAERGTTTNKVVARALFENGSGRVFTIRTKGELNESNTVVVTVSAEIITNKSQPSSHLQTIFNNTNSSTLLRALEQRGAFETLAEPKMETTGGRQAQLRVENMVENAIAAASVPKPTGSGTNAAEKNFTQTFKLDGSLREDNLKEALLAAGVKIPPTVFLYSEGGVLLVRGSDEQLALVNRALMKLNGASDQELEIASKSLAQRLNQTAATKIADTNLFTRSYKMDTRNFETVLKKSQGKTTSTNSHIAARSFIKSMGVDLESSPDKTAFYSDKSGALLVRATAPELDALDRVIETINYVPPQIHIKARFIEVTQTKSASDKSFEWHLGNFRLNETNASSAQHTNTGSIAGILNDKNFQITLRAIGSLDGSQILGEPELVTTSGRQCKMMTTDVVSIVTNFLVEENPTNHVTSITPLVSQLQTGVALDVVPQVLTDGYTIKLALKPSWIEFLGYAQTNSHVFQTSTGDRVNMPGIHPLIRTQEVASTLTVWDGQTAVLGGVISERLVKKNMPIVGKLPLLGKLFEKQETVKVNNFVFVTATIVDPAGNRVHADEELPFAQTGVPTQPTK